VRSDTSFEAVVAGCAEAKPGRTSTWINGAIAEAYADLFRQGYAHTIESWRGDRLVGGLYGVAIGGAFFGESMFSRETDASKVALVHLVAKLRAAGYVLLDTQFTTEHLARFGVVEIPQSTYRRRLAAALQVATDWSADPAPALAGLLGAPEAP
jgi:leucyl/phenylalanyl-tRNA--protein transferase